ncbi:hypothetical protein Tco_1083776 [Tanacetum coccineum]
MRCLISYQGPCGYPLSLQHLPYSPATNPGYPRRLVAGDTFPGRHVTRDKWNRKARMGFLPDRHSRATSPGPHSFIDVVMHWRNVEGDAKTGEELPSFPPPTSSLTSWDTVNTVVIDVDSQDKNTLVFSDVEENQEEEFDNVQARMEADALLAARLQEKERELHEKEKAELERMLRERAAQEETSNAALIAEFDNVQATIEVDALFTYSQLKNKSFEEIQKLYEKEQKWIKDFISMDSEEVEKKATNSKKIPRAEPDEESVKRQRIGETSGLEAYQIFADMLKKFDRDDMVKLWDLVKKRFSTTEPTNDKEKELWLLVEADSEMLGTFRRYFYQATGPRARGRIVGNKGFSKFLLLVEEATAGED